MSEHKGLSIQAFPDQAAWDGWLARHGGSSPGLWLKFAKKGAPTATVTKAEAIETALAHGWVDGQIDKFDDHHWLIRFTRRGPRSKWSQLNCATADRLVAAGRMTPAGQAEVDAAKTDGRWDAAYAPQSQAQVPPDLQAALDASPKAAAFFATLKGANRYAVLYRLHDAKTAKTRTARLRTFVAMLERSETFHR